MSHWCDFYKVVWLDFYDKKCRQPAWEMEDLTFTCCFFPTAFFFSNFFCKWVSAQVSRL